MVKLLQQTANVLHITLNQFTDAKHKLSKKHDIHAQHERTLKEIGIPKQAESKIHTQKPNKSVFK